ALGALTGSRPRVDVVGNADLAADVSWLIDNLRWDIQDDLAGLVGTAPAHQLARFAGAIASGLRSALRGIGDLVAKGADAPRPEPGAPPPR
ncbi:MAG: hypothetical protein ABIS28_06745, partial [Caldimonas sp.]